MATKEILVVDDEIGIRELLSEILFDEGYHVHLAENAIQARDFRSRQVPDLVLLDIWMPNTDGVSLLKEWAGQNLRRRALVQWISLKNQLRYRNCLMPLPRQSSWVQHQIFGRK
jgi:DNA-binding NtrC family response regulator